ncbi:MAG: cation transporter [Clostridiales bacterium]|nr:cation transporter [Clostridiales bacterium]
MVYVAFFLLAAAIVFLSLKLSKYVDLLDKTTNVSGAFIGGVLLAAVTSLPELFTSLSAVLLLKENSLVTGNILGSNLFNLAVLGICVAVMFRGFSRANIGKHYVFNLLACLGVYALIALPVCIRNFPKLGYVSLVSPFIFVLYVLTIVFTPKSEESEADASTNLTVKQIVLRFVGAAILLVGMSIAITYVSNSVAEKLDLGKTFAGALLLGVTTSLPELVSTVSLCRRGNFNAATGNIVGSNMFNFCILFLSDVLGFRKGSTGVYAYFRNGAAGMQSMLLLTLGASAALLGIIVLTVKTRAPQKKMLGHATALSCGSLMTSAYLLFLILSTVLA